MSNDKKKPTPGRRVNGDVKAHIGWKPFGELKPRLTVQQRERILDDLFLGKKANFVSYLIRFCVLLCLATVIASLGLLQNSTAVVIGAMLVAPIMEPIIAASAALVMSWPRRFMRKIFLVVCGATLSFLIAFLINMVTPDIEWATREVMSRTQPNLYDLGIAAAAGIAAVYTMIYRIDAAIPGVAVAVALLPPLAAAGIVAEQGLYNEAIGALLLFVTNFATILLVASVTFLLHGFVPQVESMNLNRLARPGILGTLVIVGAISVPLLKQTWTMYDEMKLESAAIRALEQWYPGVPREIHNIEAKGSTVKVFLSGPGYEVDYKLLAKAIAEQAARPVNLEVRWSKVEFATESYLEIGGDQ